ncbi:hypothetical protein [Paenibacillus xanthanilyticus]|uniref:Uncharacterized protein n=1 Tax=Paenibacillus xanthanilyticus TaxID=1783531 RepID=A0ABV8K3U7_9BACL
MKRNKALLWIAGVSVGISSFLVISSVNAQANVGSLMYKWYAEKSHQLKETLTDTSINEREQGTAEVNEYTTDLSKRSSEELSIATDAAMQEVQQRIRNYSEHHIERIDEVSAELAQNLNEEFGQFATTVSKEQNKQLEQLAEDAIKELTQQLNGNGAPVVSN